MNKKLTLTEFITKIPKADLHYHLLGGVRLNTMMDFAKKYGEPLSELEAKSYYRKYQNETQSTKGGIAALTFLYQLMREPEDYRRLILEVAEDAQACGLKYIETFWNPSDTLLEYKNLNSVLIKAIDDAFQASDVIIRLIPSINREKSPECAVKMVEDVIQNPHPYVLGIGIDYKEHHAPVEHFWKAYKLAKQFNYKQTAHCSEFGLHWRNVETAIELMEIDRIDHGYSIIENPELTQKYSAQQIPFTVIPSNTYFLKQWPDKNEWCKNHPIRAMAIAGLNIIPCTDDWHIHNTNSTRCYQTLIEDFGFDVLSLKTFMLNSLKSSWLPQEQKNTWLSIWSQQFDELYKDLDQTYKSPKDTLIQYRIP